MSDNVRHIDAKQAEAAINEIGDMLADGHVDWDRAKELAKKIKPYIARVCETGGEK
jgi:hypothetical protein